jgi:uncharacterized protein (DUF433 family)
MGGGERSFDDETRRHLSKPGHHGRNPVFYGTRVLVQTLLDYLEAGDSIEEFLAGFPSVTREQVINFLEAAKDRLVETFGEREAAQRGSLNTFEATIIDSRTIGTPI